MHPTSRNKALSPLHQVCIVLRFFATGSMQNSIGCWINVDQSTVSRCITRVTAAMLEGYKGGFEFNGKSTRDTFLERFGLPSITGAIDCTHIEIPVPPSELHPDEYINRKNYYLIG